MPSRLNIVKGDRDAFVYSPEDALPAPGDPLCVRLKDGTEISGIVASRGWLFDALSEFRPQVTLTLLDGVVEVRDTPLAGPEIPAKPKPPVQAPLPLDGQDG